MKKTLASILLLTTALFAQAGPAEDAETAGKLKGEWKGNWQFPPAGMSGAFVLIVTGVEGNAIKGEGHWFGTATGDQKLPISKGEVKDGKIFIEQPNDTKVTFSLDEKDGKSRLAGNWLISGYDGTVKADKQ
jgi:hypothetical protein